MVRDLTSGIRRKSDQRNQESHNESELAKIDAALDKFQKSLDGAKQTIESSRGPEVAQLKEYLAAAARSPEDMLYGSAIQTFVSTLDTSHRAGSVSDDEYTQISPMFDKWRALSGGEQFGEASFRDFQADLAEFSKANPNWLINGVSVASWFSSHVWDAHFKARRERATRLTQQIMALLGQHASSSTSASTRGALVSGIGELETSYTARGLPRYVIRVSHQQLHKYQAVRGNDPEAVSRRAQALAAQWDEMWEKRKERETAARNIEEKKRIAAERTQEARQAIEQIHNTLRHALDINDTINWESLKDTSTYPVPKPVPPDPSTPPESPQPVAEPQPEWPVFQPRMGPIDRLIPSRRAARLAEAQAAFQQAREDWERRSQEQAREYEIRLMEHAETVRKQNESLRRTVAEWEERARRFAQEQAVRNAAVGQRRDRYLASDPEAISDYCSTVLDNSSYPDSFPKSFELEYNPTNRVLMVDCQLPAPTDIPAVTEVRYVQASDEFTEKRMSPGQLNQLYDSLLYQIALRTIHELYEADAVSALESVVFNGWVHSVDPSTGQETDACVLSVQASKEEFLALNLSGVDPRACFKKLKGVSSARLHSLVPVTPLLTLSREDRRFVSSYGVVDSLSEVDNLAAMDWEDFEHLIRELFEKEFSAVGGEVKVTRASRDGGVDAVIFDPDPLRGGKTVIQAKRYTNTVGVAAVRDLYGTVLNEGANKGILVTTSDFGPDAYDFAKGKPLVLLNGGNLLHLLERHGHKAKIDIHEAKRLMGERGSP
jgi:restriction system protein